MYSAPTLATIQAVSFSSAARRRQRRRLETDVGIPAVFFTYRQQPARVHSPPSRAGFPRLGDPWARVFSFALALLALALPSIGAAAGAFGPYAVIEARALDGDTLAVKAMLSPEIIAVWRVRLVGINTPELRAGAECERRAARAAADFAATWVSAGGALLTVTGRDLYGRYLGRLSRDGEDLGSALIARGLAREYGGERRGAWCRDS